MSSSPTKIATLCFTERCGSSPLLLILPLILPGNAKPTHMGREPIASSDTEAVPPHVFIAALITQRRRRHVKSVFQRTRRETILSGLLSKHYRIFRTISRSGL